MVDVTSVTRAIVPAAIALALTTPPAFAEPCPPLHVRNPDGNRHDVIALEGAPHGLENWEGHAEWNDVQAARGGVDPAGGQVPFNELR